AGFKQYAVELGLDVEQFNSCLDSGEYAQKVKDDMAEGQANGIKGTPGFIINGELISGAQPYAVFEQAINTALEN
ncbi:DsbA family protein, partial [Candidatus Woesearchaeota archaeon]|nr:DsbA family protein [Candidatus Woesearchaeota archaeon]